MKHRLIQTLAAAMLVLGSLSFAHATDSDQENIHAVLNRTSPGAPAPHPGAARTLKSPAAGSPGA